MCRSGSPLGESSSPLPPSPFGGQAVGLGWVSSICGTFIGAPYLCGWLRCLQFHPAGHNLVPHGDRVAGYQGDRQVFGQSEDWIELPVLRVAVGVLKTEETHIKLHQHGPNVP